MTSSGSQSSEAQEHLGLGGTKESSTDLERAGFRDIVNQFVRPQPIEKESEGTTQKEPNSNSSDPKEDVFEKFKQIERRRKRLALYSATNIPLRHRDLKLESVSHKKWLEAFAKVNNKLGKGCIVAIIGGRGTGKTQMGVEAIRQACKLGRDSFYVKAVDVFISIRACYRSDAASEQNLIKIYTRYKLLVIDALEEKSDSEWENRMLSHIIDKRYDDMVDTILISNEQPAAFAKQHGSSISDRIYETGGIIECNWLSFRKEGE